MMVDAWRDSAQPPVGYLMVNVRDIESGKVRVTRRSVRGRLTQGTARRGVPHFAEGHSAENRLGTALTEH